MKRLCYPLFLGIALLMSCNSNTIIKKPDNLIPKQQMIAILTDTYLAKSAKNLTNTHGDKHISYHALIYQKHDIDSLRFHQSLKYYTSDISLNEEILKAVKATIDEQLDKKSKELEKESLEKSTKSEGS